MNSGQLRLSILSGSLSISPCPAFDQDFHVVPLFRLFITKGEHPRVVAWVVDPDRGRAEEAGATNDDDDGHKAAAAAAAACNRKRRRSFFFGSFLNLFSLFLLLLIKIKKTGKRCFVGNLAWRTSWQDLKDKFREVGTVVYANVMRDDGGGFFLRISSKKIWEKLVARGRRSLNSPPKKPKKTKKKPNPNSSGRSKGWGIVEFEDVEQAAAAISTLNGADLAGRKLLVREDREDRDVRAARGENGEEGGERPPRRERPPPRPRAPRPPREERPEASSGLQVVVQGLPWSYTWKELRPLFDEYGEVERADVVIGRDGRSRGYGTVRFTTPEAASAAIEGKHATELEGRTLTVKLDRFA